MNIGKGEVLVGIEILDAKDVLGAGRVPDVILEGLGAGTSLAVREKAPVYKTARNQSD
jgi:hypothetical protein